MVERQRFFSLKKKKKDQNVSVRMQEKDARARELKIADSQKKLWHIAPIKYARDWAV